MPNPPHCAERERPPTISNRVNPPRGVRNLMPREALIARLQEARRQRCVVLQGPAGCGRTSTLLAWRRELMALNFDVAWLTLAGEDGELTRFCNALLASLATVDPAIVRDAAALTGHDGDDLTLEHWVIALVQGLARHPQELVLMLDDLHVLGEPRIFRLLQWLLDYAPDQFHLVLGSRSTVPMPAALTRLRAQGLVTELGLRDLRFSAEESDRFLRNQLGDIARRDTEALHDLTDGWVTGLQLFAIDLRTRPGADDPQARIRDAGTFASYFEQEVLAHLAPDDLDLLLRASICNRFCASLCAALLGQPGAQSEVVNRLLRLDGESLFISRIDSPERDAWYRLHPLLREVLRGRLEARAKIDLRALHAAARGWFSERGHVEEAVRHAIQAGDEQAAADIVEACASELLAQGELSHLDGLLRRLPPEQMRQRFALQLVMAHIHLYTRNYAALEQGLAQLESPHEHLDPCQRYHLTLLRGGMAMMRDDSATALALLPDLLAIPAGADDFLQTGRSNVLAWLYMYQGEYEHAREILDAGERPAGSPRRSLIGRCMGGVSLIIEGRITQAEHIFREVLEEAEPQGPAFAPVAFMAAGLLASALYELNECEAVCALLEPRIGLLERSAMPDAVLQALLMLASSHWLAGRRAEAHAQLDRLEEYAGQHHLDRLRAAAMITRQGWLRQQGQGEQAAAVLREVVTLAARYADASQGTEGEIRTTGKRAQIELCLLGKDLDGAVALLVPLIRAAEEGRRWRRSAGLRLQLAMVEHGRGNLTEYRRQLIEALRLGHRLGLLRTLLNAPSRLPKLLAELLGENLLDPVLAFYAQRLIAAAEPASNDSGEDAVTIDALSEREREVVALLAHAMPNKKIARALNVSPETVKWHLKNIYLKLGVSGRDEAIARMRDLSIPLPPGRNSPSG